MASTGSASEELATAIGRYVLGEVSLGKAAETAGLSRWEFEIRLQEAGFDALYGPRTDDQLADEIDTARNLNE
jgi:predicted HTH domain antitoxin